MATIPKTYATCTKPSYFYRALPDETLSENESVCSQGKPVRKGFLWCCVFSWPEQLRNHWSSGKESVLDKNILLKAVRVKWVANKRASSPNGSGASFEKQRLRNIKSSCLWITRHPTHRSMTWQMWSLYFCHQIPWAFFQPLDRGIFQAMKSTKHVIELERNVTAMSAIRYTSGAVK